MEREIRRNSHITKINSICFFDHLLCVGIFMSEKTNYEFECINGINDPEDDPFPKGTWHSFGILGSLLNKAEELLWSWLFAKFFGL